MTVPAAVVLVRSERETSETKGLVARTREAAERIGVPPIKTFRAKRRSVVGEPWHGPVEFLEPNDAHELYRLLHRWHALVLSFAPIYVRKDPRRQPAERRAALELGTFVEHKAEFELIRNPAALQATITGFKSGSSVLSCAGEDDPRCLPLHVFSTAGDWSVLSNQRGRDAFADLYGPGRSRVDGDSKRWVRADRGAYHGRDDLTVAGRELPRGMHWDVTSERGPISLTTTHEVWEVPRRRRGYLNVYPDAYVRRGGTGSRARRVWAAN